MSTYVFLGPSLRRARARELLDANYLPPAQAGDLIPVVDAGARVIAVVDGFFEQVPAVWHKEILYALSRGVHVFGAASMGALRAAELADFGMVGVGAIFERYRDGTYEDDDEVTVMHGAAESGFQPLSDAMVNLRAGLAEALGAGLISQATHDQLVCGFKSTYYPLRSWSMLDALARTHRLPAEEIGALREFVRRERPDVKARDAELLLQTLGRLAATHIEPHQPQFDFEDTIFWRSLLAARRGPTSSGEVPAVAIRQHVAVSEENGETIQRGALLLYMVASEARRLRIELTPAQVRGSAERFRRARGLLSAAATRSWMADNRLDQAAFSELMEMLALVEVVADRNSAALAAFITPELQRRGRFGTVVAAVEDRRRVLDGLGLRFPGPGDVGTTPEALLQWYERRSGGLSESLQEHARRLGFESDDAFVRHLAAEYFYQQRAAPREELDA